MYLKNFYNAKAANEQKTTNLIKLCFDYQTCMSSFSVKWKLGQQNTLKSFLLYY